MAGSPPLPLLMAPAEDAPAPGGLGQRPTPTSAESEATVVAGEPEDALHGLRTRFAELFQSFSTSLAIADAVVLPTAEGTPASVATRAPGGSPPRLPAHFKVKDTSRSGAVLVRDTTTLEGVLPSMLAAGTSNALCVCKLADHCAKGGDADPKLGLLGYVDMHTMLRACVAAKLWDESSSAGSSRSASPVPREPPASPTRKATPLRHLMKKLSFSRRGEQKEAAPQGLATLPMSTCLEFLTPKESIFLSVASSMPLLEALQLCLHSPRPVAVLDDYGPAGVAGTLTAASFVRVFHDNAGLLGVLGDSKLHGGATSEYLAGVVVECVSVSHSAPARLALSLLGAHASTAVSVVNEFGEHVGHLCVKDFCTLATRMPDQFPSLLDVTCHKLCTYMETVDPDRSDALLPVFATLTMALSKFQSSSQDILFLLDNTSKAVGAVTAHGLLTALCAVLLL